MIDRKEYISIRTGREPGDLKSKKVKRSHTNGVLLHIGYRTDGDSILLEYLFPCRHWTEDKAHEWVKQYNQNWRGTMDGLKEAVWSAAFVNDLPDSSFAYIEAGGSKDAAGKTTPRSLRHFPIKDAAGKPDAAHVRNALARASQSSFGSNALPKIRAAARTLGIGQPAKESHKKDPKVPTVYTLKEKWDGSPLTGKVERDNFAIRDVALLNSKAQEGRRFYPVAVMQKAEKLFEGRPVFFNHPADGKEHEIRDVKEKIGVLENVRTTDNQDGTGTLRADLNVMAGPTGTWMMDIAEKTPKMAGFSINAHGGLLKDDTGKELVERIDGVHSVDLVSEASATVSIFESLKKAQQVQEDEDMELKEQIKELETKLTEQSDQLTALTTERDTLAKGKTDLEEKLKIEEHEAMIAKVLAEAKLPDAVDETLLAALKKCETEDEAKKFAEALKKAAGEADPDQDEGDHPLNEDKKGKDKKGLTAEKLAESIKEN